MNLTVCKVPINQTALFSLFAAITVVGLLLVIHFDWMPLGMILWVIFLIGGLFGIVRQHVRTAAYTCPGCGGLFKITATADFLSPQFGRKKLLKCPGCGQSSWCREVGAGGTDVEVNQAITPKIAGGIASNRRWLYVQVGIVIAAYLLLWANALRLYSRLPETLLTYFVNSDLLGTYGSKSSVLALPALAALLPLLHGLFTLYAARQGYKSLVYPIFTGAVVVILTVLGAVQYLHLAGVMMR